MSKKVLILSTSLRGKSNSAILAREFERGAAEAGNDVEFLSLSGKKLAFCVGCLTCQKTGKCILPDDANAIAEKIRQAEVLVFATPVYYYSMSGQMKTLLDRCNCLYGSDYAFREVYLLATAADDDEHAMDGTVTGVEGWLACFEKASLAGVLRGIGLDAPGQAAERDELKARAYAMGQQV